MRMKSKVNNKDCFTNVIFKKEQLFFENTIANTQVLFQPSLTPRFQKENTLSDCNGIER